MLRSLMLLAALALALALVACGSSSTGLDDELDENVMTANVGGVAFTAVDVQVSSAGGGSLSFVGNTSLTESPVLSISIAVNAFVGPGTYDLGPSTASTAATYTSTPSGGPPSQWSTQGAEATGTITISTYTSSIVAGTFQFTGTADAGTAATGTVSVTSGTFALGY